MTSTTAPSLLTSLRSLTPTCRIDTADTLALAERQAALLRRLLLTPGEALDEHHLATLPRLRIVRDACPTSGLSYWSGTEWIIVLNRADNPGRQRFTLLHEYKHIIDHGHATRLYRTTREAERTADYFAGCALIPKLELKRAFYAGTQRVEDLADYFGVSRAAIKVGLGQANLIDPEPGRARCARPIRTPSWQPQRFQVARPVAVGGWT